ncbi:serine/threonine-protein phosphatase 4 regulatory subunit 1 isoform X2 [Harpegnathos saltator]|nr:serine/threonine-protein phosphatase 4 regulatory subunit 1 isoform X2 [Harpegnathos saltator]XP_025158612.1 serine/threonine-protein phosphatase 4 regulatory subunit 1 isoform X2 [Harpegnathos saltator]
MEAEDDEEVNSSNVQSDGSGPEMWDGAGGGGDEAERAEQLFHISRLQQHANSETSFNRQMVGRILVEMFRAAANNGTKLALPEIMHCIQPIIEDTDAQVRSDLVEQLPHVAMICHEAPQLFGRGVLRKHLLDIIIKYLRDMDKQVRLAAQNALLTLMKRGLLHNNTIENEICPVVEFLSYLSADFLSTSVSLMCKLAPLIGKELTERVFLDRYIDMCEDDDMSVRRICATHFGEMCAVVSRKALFRKLFPTFIHLCGDRVWGVRKACVDVMMPVSCCSTLEHRRLFLAEILTKHLKDESKWVRMSAFQILGPFISTFAKQFTEVSYNQHGELVYTSTQDNYFSVRYPYEGMFPMKSVMRNQTPDMDDNAKGASFHMSVINTKSPVAESWEGNEHQKNNDPTNRPRCVYYTAFKNKMQKRPILSTLREKDTDETEKYNPFLYYYIPPEAPLDDELIHAARQSAMNRNNAEKVAAGKENVIDENSSSSSESTSSSSNNEEEEEEEEEEELNTKGQPNVDKLDNHKEEDNDDYSSTHDANELLEDTLYICCTMNQKSIPFSFNNKLDTIKKQGEHDIVPQELIRQFVSMVDPEQCADMGAEIPHHCAFSFPAVTLTLGKEKWYCLKKAYQSLSSAKQWKVRRTLASSIHEIALILGEELTATDLVPIYDGFIKDLDEVRIGVLKHLATFLKILKPTDRCQYLPRLSDFLATDNEWNWRFREELATQLLEAVTLFSPKDVAKSIAPLSLQLLVDKIAAVRTVALDLVTRIVSHLSVDDALVTSLIHELRDTLVPNSKKWIRRQTYAILCAHLLHNGAVAGSMFTKEMLPNLIGLSFDRVPNVRLAVARTLANNVSTMGLDGLGAERMEEVDRILKKMRLDADRDVRVLAGGEEQLVDTVSQDCVVVPQDEAENKQPRNILSYNEVVYVPRTRMRRENELFVSQDAPPFFHASD